MPLDYDRLMSLPPMEVRHSYTARDTILYALGVGAGADPQDLPYVFEEGLVALPTMAVVLAYPGFWQKEPRYGIDWRRVLHGEQAITVHAPLPVEGAVVGVLRIEAIYDKGADKGALLYSAREIHDEATGVHLATVRQGSFLRGDGGFGGTGEGAPVPHPVPAGPPDLSIALPTRPEQALIYRLSGDDNPLHADPAVAASAGFERPILHGLCTYGVVGRALIRALGGPSTRLARMDARFSRPVYPGETLRTDIWRQPDGRAAFQATVVERDQVVLTNGYAQFE